MRRAVLACSLCLSACVTPQMHSEAQLNSVATGCGLSVGEVFQDDSEKRLLFLMRPSVSAGQRICVARWAKKNHLHLAIVEAINFPAS